MELTSEEVEEKLKRLMKRDGWLIRKGLMPTLSNGQQGPKKVWADWQDICPRVSKG